MRPALSVVFLVLLGAPQVLDGAPLSNSSISSRESGSARAGEGVYNVASPSVVTLRAVQHDGNIALGTAFLAIKDGVAVTAWHVVNGAERVSAKFSSGEEFDVSGLIDKDEARDLALVRIKAYGHPMLQLSPVSPEIGSRAYVIGAPKGLEFTISEGLVSQRQMIAGTEQYQFSCAASPGNSGGPLLDSKGIVLGIVSWQVREGQNLNFAIPSKYALGLDASLPTQPWQNVKSEGTFPSTAITTSEKVDSLLARALGVLMSDESALRNTGEAMMEPGASKGGVPAWNYMGSRDAAELIEQLAACHSEDPDREATRELIMKRLRSVLEALDLQSQAIRAAGTAGGWGPDAMDLWNRGIAAAQSEYAAGWDSSSVRVFTRSKIVMRNVPPDGLMSAGFAPDSSGFRLGVFTWFYQPLTLDSNPGPGTFAASIGLIRDDQILSAGGQSVQSVAELKRILVVHRGRKIEIVVQRGGKPMTIRARIPSESTGKP